MKRLPVVRPELETLRARLHRAEDKKAIDWFKWIGSPTAWLALILSSTSLYFNIFRQLDNINAIIDIVAIPSENDNKRFDVTVSNRQIILTNNGNRYAILRNCWVTIEKYNKPSENGIKIVYSDYVILQSSDETIIKPGEMIIKTLDVNNDLTKSANDRWIINGNKMELSNNIVEKGDRVKIDIVFVIVTPDGVNEEIRKTFLDYDLRPGLGALSNYLGVLKFNKKAVNLKKDYTNIFTQ